jgi:CRISPR/Cas system-associated protein Csm6
MEQKDGGKGEFKLSDSSAKDDIFLLATDTMEGAFCACCLRNYLLGNNSLPPLIRSFIREVRLIIVSGLQVEDADLFRAEGAVHLKEVRDTAVTWASDQGCSKVYLNVTGGYKGVLPVITALGLARNWYLYYAYEASPARIDVEVQGVTFRDREKFRIRSTSQKGIHENSV